MKLRGKSI